MAFAGVYDRRKFAMSLELNFLLPSPDRGDRPLFPEALLLYGHCVGNLVGIVILNSEASGFGYS